MKTSKAFIPVLLFMAMLSFSASTWAQSKAETPAQANEIEMAPIGQGGKPSDRLPPPRLSESEEDTAEITLYPNPGNGLVNIELPAGQKTTIKVFDLAGNLHFQSEINLNANQRLQIDFQNAQSGLYLVHIGDKVVKYYKF